MIPLFTITIFLAAALLFGVQPMVAKSLLPGFGGGSSVWTTCMLFFQTLLIAGYLYAHLLLRFVPRRGQLVVHGVVIASALVVGWMYQTPKPPASATEFPVPWLILQLFLIAGLPYFAISSAGPLIQGWFARTGHQRSVDPYFLYAASNAGSFVGLLAYPLWLEPSFGLDTQRALWLVGFVLFGVLAGMCLIKTRQQAKQSDGVCLDLGADVPIEPIRWKRRLWWAYLGFVPSSMLLAVTMHITTDVASFPLLWVIPLALYLVSMILAFSKLGAGIVRWGVRPMILTIIAAWVLLFAANTAERGAPISANILIQLLLLLAVGCYAHARLAQDRPPASRLTEFYLVMSIGGALGGLFNGIIAPLMFNDVYEYHVTLLAALLVIPGLAASRTMQSWAVRLWPVLISLVFVLIYVVVVPGISNSMLPLAAGAIVPGVLMYISWRDRIACAGVLLFPLLALAVHQAFDPALLHKERTFYGVHTVGDRVMETGRNERVVIRRLLHGTTLHGLQKFVDDKPSVAPMGYYHVNGPLGGVMRAIDADYPDGARVCLIGMGTGASAVYARPQDTFEYYEIDPAVVRIARDLGYFSYLASAPSEIGIRVGDGRLLLEESERSGEPAFDLILVDAFSSDSIPTHLLTVEAIRLYFERLGPKGVVAMHVSNRHLDLTGLVYSTAKELGVEPLLYNDEVTLEFSEQTGRFASVWVALTADPDSVVSLRRAGFSPYTSSAGTPVWTDQYSNLLSVFVSE